MLSIPHLIIIFVVALVVFGPEKLPELARNLGKVMAEFRRATGELRNTFEGHLQDLERESQQRRIGGSAPAQAALPAQTAPGTVASNPPNAAAVASPESESQEGQSSAEEQSHSDAAPETHAEKLTDAGSHPA